MARAVRKRCCSLVKLLDRSDDYDQTEHFSAEKSNRLPPAGSPQQPSRSGEDARKGWTLSGNCKWVIKHTVAEWRSVVDTAIPCSD